MYTKNLNITNEILAHYYNSDRVPRLDVSLYDDKNNGIVPQIQIEVDYFLFRNFAFFYDLKEEIISFSSIVELDNPISLEAFKVLKNVFEKEEGPFQSLLASDDELEEGEITELNFFSRVNVKDFNKEYLTKLDKYLEDYEGGLSDYILFNNQALDIVQEEGSLNKLEKLRDLCEFTLDEIGVYYYNIIEKSEDNEEEE